MAVFPDVIPDYGSTIEPRWRTLINSTDTDNEQRIAKRAFPVFDVRLKFGALSKANFALLWDFYCARRGSYEAFYWFAPESDTYKGLFVGIGTGSKTIWDLPGKSTSARTLYKNGQLQSSGFTYLTGGGEGGADRVQFDAAPANGDVLSVDFTGILRVKCRFENDRLTKEFFEILLYRSTIDLKGLPGE